MFLSWYMHNLINNIKYLMCNYTHIRLDWSWFNNFSDHIMIYGLKFIFNKHGKDDNYVLLFQKISEKCFKKCITKPGSSLDNSEQVSTVLIDWLKNEHSESNRPYIPMILTINNPSYRYIWHTCTFYMYTFYQSVRNNTCTNDFFFFRCKWHLLKHHLRQVSGFLRVLWFPPPIKLTATI